MIEDFKDWSYAVLVHLDGRDIQIARTIEALGILQGVWPTPDTSKHHRAIKVCATAVAGDEPDLAQAAFLDAAIEAGILVR